MRVTRNTDAEGVSLPLEGVSVVLGFVGARVRKHSWCGQRPGGASRPPRWFRRQRSLGPRVGVQGVGGLEPWHLRLSPGSVCSLGDLGQNA